MNLPIPLEVQLDNGDWFWVMDYCPLPGIGLFVEIGYSGKPAFKAVFAIIPDWPTF